jgi:hypothetical protein
MTNNSWIDLKKLRLAYKSVAVWFKKKNFL